ncbi:MAG: ester cyclase [Actinomycetes bacterium]
MTHAERFRDGVEAVNARDWATQRAQMADDVTSVDHGTETTVKGAEAFQQWQRANMAGFPDQVLSITSMVESGDVLWVELLVEATHTEPMPLPTGGELPATGRRTAIHVACKAEYDANGKVKGMASYVNPLELMGQLGLLSDVPDQINLSERETTKSR